MEAYARQKESGLELPDVVVCAHENLAVGMAHGYRRRRPGRAQLRAGRRGRARAARACCASLRISYRLNTVRDADVVVVLVDGVVAELGTHTELMALDGGYAGRFRLQAGGYEQN